MFRFSLYILAIIALLTGLILGTLNADKVSVDLLWWQFSAPLGGILVLAFVVGALAGVFALYVTRVLPLRMALKRSQKNQAKLNSVNGDSLGNTRPPTKNA